jgi:hypothetical protein
MHPSDQQERELSSERLLWQLATALIYIKAVAPTIDGWCYSLDGQLGAQLQVQARCNR